MSSAGISSANSDRASELILLCEDCHIDEVVNVRLLTISGTREEPVIVKEGST